MGENTYHHVDLKKEMIQKGIQLLTREGYEGFSLRKLAALCNVSHAAPYRHFRNKDELIGAINQEISSGFREAFTSGVLKYENNPKMQLMELCRQYIRFMVNNPDYFRYVFMTVHERSIVFIPGDVQFEEEGHPFSIGKRFAQEYFRQLDKPDIDWAVEFLALWSQIQGLTLLLVNRTIEYRGDYLEFAKTMLEHYFDSIENR